MYNNNASSNSVYTAMSPSLVMWCHSWQPLISDDIFTVNCLQLANVCHQLNCVAVVRAVAVSSGIFSTLSKVIWYHVTINFVFRVDKDIIWSASVHYSCSVRSWTALRSYHGAVTSLTLLGGCGSSAGHHPITGLWHHWPFWVGVAAVLVIIQSRGCDVSDPSGWVWQQWTWLSVCKKLIKLLHSCRWLQMLMYGTWWDILSPDQRRLSYQIISHRTFVVNLLQIEHRCIPIDM